MVNNQICNETNMTSLKDKCALYDIAPARCTDDNVKNVEKNCATHELKYYDSNLGMYVNSNSPFYCHSDLSGMDNYCKTNGINECNFTNMSKSIAQTNNMPLAKQEIAPEMIEPMSSDISSESNDNKNCNNNLYFLIFICVALLIFLIGIYFYRKKIFYNCIIG
jgi:hypothetical protein